MKTAYKIGTKQYNSGWIYETKPEAERDFKKLHFNPSFVFITEIQVPDNFKNYTK